MRLVSAQLLSSRKPAWEETTLRYLYTASASEHLCRPSLSRTILPRAAVSAPDARSEETPDQYLIRWTTISTRLLMKRTGQPRTATPRPMRKAWQPTSNSMANNSKLSNSWRRFCPHKCTDSAPYAAWIRGISAYIFEHIATRLSF